jgi:hypothetical protein
MCVQLPHRTSRFCISHHIVVAKFYATLDESNIEVFKRHLHGDIYNDLDGSQTIPFKIVAGEQPPPKKTLSFFDSLALVLSVCPADCPKKGSDDCTHSCADIDTSSDFRNGLTYALLLLQL